jgi:uncharacterized protein (DUF608 family)
MDDQQIQDMKDQLDHLLMAKPETGEQWADICLLEQEIVEAEKRRNALNSIIRRDGASVVLGRIKAAITAAR